MSQLAVAAVVIFASSGTLACLPGLQMQSPNQSLMAPASSRMLILFICIKKALALTRCAVVTCQGSASLGTTKPSTKSSPTGCTCGSRKLVFGCSCVGMEVSSRAYPPTLISLRSRRIKNAGVAIAGNSQDRRDGRVKASALPGVFSSGLLWISAVVNEDSSLLLLRPQSGAHLWSGRVGWDGTEVVQVFQDAAERGGEAGPR